MIQIDEMVLRVPGMAEEEASRFGADVAQHVADALPADITQCQVFELQVTINESSIAPGVSMAEAVAEQIIRQIKMYSL
ncbi:MAG: hypothetical protein J7621_19505 [Niastella sp.]|nr:hypothetical protein [Niastella sp.]